MVNAVSRLLFSIVGAITIILGLLLPSAWLPNQELGFRIIGTLLYWPMSLMDALHLGPGCANADAVGEKLNCASIFLMTDVLVYSLVIYSVSTLLIRHRNHFDEPTND